MNALSSDVTPSTLANQRALVRRQRTMAATDSWASRTLVQQLAVGREASVRAPIPGQLRDRRFAGVRSEPRGRRRVHKDLGKPLAQCRDVARRDEVPGDSVLHDLR